MTEEIKIKAEAPGEPEVEAQTYDQVVAETVTIQQGGAKSVKATTVQVMEGGIAMADAESIEVGSGGIALAKGGDITVKGGGVAVAIGQKVELDNASAVLVVAREVSGDAKILIDLRAALLFGAVLGVVIGAIKFLAGRRD